MKVWARLCARKFPCARKHPQPEPGQRGLPGLSALTPLFPGTYVGPFIEEDRPLSVDLSLGCGIMYI